MQCPFENYINTCLTPEEKPQFLIFTHLKGEFNKDASAQLHTLFGPINDVFLRTFWGKAPKEIKNLILKEIFESIYPILKSAPEVYDHYHKEAAIQEKLLITRTIRLAFREYRHNNGLWDKNYTQSQKRDVTEMFLECLSKTPSCSFDWKKFIAEVGKFQDVKKPRLTKGRIEKAIVKASC